MNELGIKDKILEFYNISDDLYKNTNYTLNDLFLKTLSIKNNTTFEKEYINDYSTWDGICMNSTYGVVCIFMDMEKLFRIEITDMDTQKLIGIKELCEIIEEKLDERKD